MSSHTLIDLFSFYVHFFSIFFTFWETFISKESYFENLEIVSYVILDPSGTELSDNLGPYGANWYKPQYPGR